MKIIDVNTILYTDDIIYEPFSHMHYVIGAIIGQTIIMYPLTYWGTSSQQITINRSTMNGKLILLQVAHG